MVKIHWGNLLSLLLIIVAAVTSALCWNRLNKLSTGEPTEREVCLLSEVKRLNAECSGLELNLDLMRLDVDQMRGLVVELLSTSAEPQEHVTVASLDEN